jgi:hypothetical protein
MIISQEQYNSLPIHLQKHFTPIGGGDGVSRNAHPT